MTQRFSILIVLSVLLLGCSSVSDPPTTSATSVAQAQEAQQLPVTATARMGGEMIQLEVARTPQQQALGLMFREELPRDRGMLFPFDPPRQVSFWMKNVEIPLDMVFVRDGVIRDIAANVPPCASEPCPSYGPSEPVDQVIELGGGQAAKLGLEVGDRVTIEFSP
ncbi:MAG: DUF192 domain-containing protein [Kamptonema sp. SIO4C4]|nr:DUF192 domain-containing protein [Kamptonema sp. SIO4C4]